jgi:hypothetical protein
MDGFYLPELIHRKYIMNGSTRNFEAHQISAIISRAAPPKCVLDIRLLLCVVGRFGPCKKKFKLLCCWLRKPATHPSLASSAHAANHVTAGGTVQLVPIRQLLRHPLERQRHPNSSRRVGATILFYNNL